MDVELTAVVTAVTVYSQQARITVQASAKVEKGSHRLVVGDLPLTLDAASIRAGGSGSAMVRVHGVEVRRHHLEETPAERVRELETKIEALEDDLKAIAAERDVLDAQGRYVEGLRDESKQFAKGLALGKTNVESQERISNFLQAQDRALRVEARELDKKSRELQRTLDKLRRELDQVASARPRQRNQA